MTSAWEYMEISYSHVASSATMKRQMYYVRRSDQPDEEIHAKGNRWVDVLNFYGKQGWELVSALVHDTVIAPTKGWQEAAIPVQVDYVFKRPAPEGQP